jgi:hypothetical protein
VLHRSVVLIVGLLIAGALGSSAQAQSIRLSLDDVPLAKALAEVRQQAGLDLVYAERLVRDRTATCSYAGTDRSEALRCVLQGTGLAAERIRRGQYVLAASSGTETDDAPPKARRVALSGYVRDADTGETLPGAHVTLADLQAGTTTNRAGYFVFSSLPPGPYEMRISFLGFETVDTTLVAGREAATIALRPTTLSSDEVLVRADSGNGNASESRPPGMMSVALDRIEQLPSLGEPDLFKALQWTPGIRKSGVISGGLSVRGADPDQNLYLLDGAPVYHPWHAFSLISTFQTGTLQNTTLYRGSFPAEFGGRLSSVLDAQMKDGRRSEPSAVAGISVLSGRFRIEAPLSDQTSFMVSGRRSYIDKLIGRTHPVTDASGRRDTLRTGYYFYDTSAKLTHRFRPGHRVSLSYYEGRDDLDLRLPFDLSLDFSSWLRPTDLFFEVEQGWENRIVSAQHQLLLSDDVFLTSTGYYSGYRAQEKSFVQPTTTASLRSDYDVELDDVGLKVQADYHHSVAHQFQAGLHVKALRFESTLDSRLKRSSGTVDTLSQESPLDAVQAVAHVQDVWNPTPKWSIQPGLRLSYFSGGDHVHLRPRLSVRYTVHPRLAVVRAAAGMHVQYLHRLRDRYSLAYDLVTSRWVPATSTIRPASGTQVGAGLRSQPLPGLTLELSGYSRWTRNLLVPADVFREKEGFEGPGIEVGALRGQFARGDERAFGTELTALWEQGLWDVRFGVATGRTFVRAPERSGDRWRPADLDVPLSVRGAVSWTGSTWEATLAAEARSGYPISVPVARYRVGDPVEDPASFLYRPQINNGRLPPYLRLDASLGYRFDFLSARWTAKLTLFNASNRSNVVDRAYLPTSSGVAVDNQKGLPVLPLFEIEMDV